MPTNDAGSPGSRDPQACPRGDAAFFRHIVECAADLIVRCDSAWRRTYVSPACGEILGFEPAELLGGNGFALVHPEDRDSVRVVLEKLGADNPATKLTFRMRRKDGRFIWIEGRYRYMPEDGGIVSILRDIDARKRGEEALAEAHPNLRAANRRLQNLADQDGLTGLANRRRFDAVLADEFRRARRQELPVGLVLLDIDFFKRYNDRYGHLAGDECLIRVSRAVAGALKRPGDVPARYGGEEIAVVLPTTDSASALHVGERIRASVEALRLDHAASPLGIVTISAGVGAMIPVGADDCPAGLIATADRALYRAKADGRNKVHDLSQQPIIAR